MATKTFDELKQLAIQIRDEKTNKQNTATRVGTEMLEHINKLEQDYYDKTKTDEELKERDDKLTELENKIGSQTVEVDTELNEDSQKPIANAPVAKGINEVKQQLSTQLPDIEEAKENAIAEIGNKESDAIQNFSEQRVTPGMLSPETIQIINASGGGTINNLPDGETLAEIEMAEGLKAIGIPNRQPDTNLGYVILKKNKSLIEQITDANTIYEVRYAYDLGGETLAMPENCVLKFEGGIISNGTIKGNLTKIESAAYQIFENIEFRTKDGDSFNTERFEKSYFIADIVPVEWFGAVSQNFDAEGAIWIPDISTLVDSSDAINNAILFSRRTGGKAYLSGKLYLIEKTVNVLSHTTLYISNNSAIIVRMNGSGIMDGESEPRLALKSSEYIPTSSMAVGINMTGLSSRIEGHGQILLSYSTYTIGILIKGAFYSEVDTTYSSYVDVRIIGGLRNNTAPDLTDTFGDGEPTSDTEGTYYYDRLGKKMYKKSNDTWSYWKNADARYNTSFRADLTQTGSDYRLLGTNFNIWDIYGFRGIEVIQSGSCWYNDAVWKGSIANKCSNYITFIGTGVAQHDMRTMFYQSGLEQNDSSPICYCEAHTILLGRVWDLSVTKTSSIRFIFTEKSYDCTAQWVTSSNSVQDSGSNNKIVSGEIDYDNPDNIGSYLYYNILKWKKPALPWGPLVHIVKSKKEIDMKDFVISSNYESTTETETDDLKIEEISGKMFDESLVTYDTLIDTSNSIFASTWYLCPGNAYQDWTCAKNKYLVIEFSVEPYDNKDIYVGLGGGANLGKKEFNLINTLSSGIYSRNKIVIPSPSGSSPIYFYSKSNSEGQLLKVYNVKLFVDSFYLQSPEDFRAYINDTWQGKTSKRPNSSPSGHLYFDTDLGQQLINVGTSDDVKYVGINSIQVIEHKSSETTIDSLIPNRLHKWGVVDSIYITSLKKISDSSLDEYMIEFECGDTPTSLTISGVKWNQKPSDVIKANSKCQVSIVNGLAVIGVFENE